MLKKIVKTTLITLVVALISLGYCSYNLKHYSVFYAKSTPHKPGVEPVLMELVDNLWWIERPDALGISYDFDGMGSIHNANFKIDSTPFFTPLADNQYHYVNGSFMSYLFDSDFKLVSYGNREILSMDLSKADVEAIKKEIYKMVQPVINAQPMPFFNLQWLYDQMNREKFN